MLSAKWGFLNRSVTDKRDVWTAGLSLLEVGVSNLPAGYLRV
jgi:hypothetical protein